MRISLIAAIALSLILPAAIATHTQNSSELMALGDNLISAIQSNKPDWKYQTVRPITDSTNVILQQWTFDYQSIRIAIISHRSTQDASATISKLAREGQLNERIQGLGDEGITWGRGVVSFRKRNFTIDISATNTKATLDPTELTKGSADERKLAKEFALLVADVIKDK